ncbi:MAG: TetR/AcrR family transcriptional regulator [Desulfobacterales bacterium]|nr:TetR/AcrR family transcriptional regulator [Desulfobacterales bacterium]
MTTAKSTARTDAKTRQILKAARTILARRGYAGTTVSLVAAEAGVSRGLLHYYFKNKEDMLARVIDENMAASVILVEDLLARSRNATEIADRLVEALQQLFKIDPDFFSLFFEAEAAARQSPALEAQLQTLYGNFRRAVQKGLQAAIDRGDIAPPIPATGLSAILTSIIDGLGLQLITETDLVDDRQIWDAAHKSVCLLLGEKV